MTIYKHTQIGYLMLVVTLLTALLFIGVGIIIPPEEHSLALTSLMTFVILLLLSFSTLQTVVDGTYLKIKFGYGIFRKKYVLEHIASASVVRNHWCYGWGIRLWLWPRMIIYNVSGFDAVELVMKNGKIRRVGTDVPHELAREIQKYLRTD